ncbi:MAG: FecR domain-containing protein, partial [Chitinophagaceae bacterium]|nr:FecR domain-containing protein [Chitinophagaceae bacterium]
SPVKEISPVADVKAPKSSTAVLTLANGEKVVLDRVNSGIMAIQGQVQLEKSATGEIIYKIKGKEAGQPPSYNLLENPRGSNIISVMLSDGTKIWLNSESSLRYPTFFHGEKREIEITGEAYLEVAHDAKHPFIVQKENTKVTVLGTRFNINTYEEEPLLKITLLEGKVSVAQREESATLLPGQQAAINRKDWKIKVSDDIDTEDAIAWLNGQFVLDGTQLKSLMDQISRWYDVIYKDKMVNRSFGGMIDRNVPLSRMLEALRENGIDCRLEGRKIVIEN